MNVYLVTAAAVLALAACSSGSKTNTSPTSEEKSQEAVQQDNQVAANSDKLIPAMYDFKTNPDRGAHDVATALVNGSTECVGHFQGPSVKLFFIYYPADKKGVMTAYTMGGDRYKEQFEGLTEAGSLKVMLVDGSPAAEIISPVQDNTLFQVTSLFKDQSGDVVLYAGNWFPAPQGIMQSRTVEMYCGQPKSEEWSKKVDGWKSYVTTLQDTNFIYI